jgi:hemerythrin-like domain-containing protein
VSRQPTATGTLRDEHRTILKVLDAFERILDDAGTRAANGEPAAEPVQDLRDCVTFFRSFADACHHGKEEDLLFTELEERGLPREHGPIGVMLQEHRMGRAYVKEMTGALERMDGGESQAWDRFVGAGRDYLDLMRGHIGKEDGVLFEMADQLVSGPACARLCKRYEEVCSRRFEGRTKDELERLADRLAARAGRA